jgi:Uma2 family endonuclease
MATSTHLITADELLEMGGDARFELWEGVLKEVSPSSVKPGLIGMRIGSAILGHVEAHDLGYVSNAESGYILSTTPHTVVAPDVGFFRPDRYPGDFPERGYFPMPPDLAVEVISPTDKRADIARKQQLYARAEVPLVWWVDPEARTVTVHRLGQAPEVLDESMTLEGEEVLPGFSLPVERIFALKRAAHRD